jgi:hypothetical protein
LSQHTPGPWTVTDDWYIGHAHGGGTFAEVKSCARVPTQAHDEHRANARLIAAAPEMLAALRAILAEPYGCSLCDSGKPRNPSKGHQADCPFEAARAAITRAEGKSGAG